MQRPVSALVLAAALAACDARPAVVTRSPSDTLPAAPTVQPALPPDRAIRPDGIGIARIGMTIGELRAALPQDMTLAGPSPFMVDIDALPVIQQGDTLYHVLIVAGEPSSDDTAIGLLATLHTAFRTAAGVGPGSTLAEATAAWGEPILSYNTSNESREFASFAALPATIMVRVMPASDSMTFAGIYAEAGEYNETSRYDPSARISMVLVRR